MIYRVFNTALLLLTAIMSHQYVQNDYGGIFLPIFLLVFILIFFIQTRNDFAAKASVHVSAILLLLTCALGLVSLSQHFEKVIQIDMVLNKEEEWILFGVTNTKNEKIPALEVVKQQENDKILRYTIIL